MAVITNCESIIAAYTHCENVIAIYTHCQLVWPLGPVPPGQWYVSWRPSTVTGEFYMWGSTRRYEDYPDCIYSWSGPASTSGLINGMFYWSSTLGGMTYMETNVKSIGSMAFYNNRSLEVISCSRVKYIGEDAFSYCINLQYVSLPRCTFIDSGAFDQCSSVSYAYLPRVSSVSAYAFDLCRNLSSLYAPVLEYVGQRAFQTTALTTLDLPSCSYIGTEGFRGCTDLSQVSLPVCELLQADVFSGCTSLESIYLPACSMATGGFRGCVNLSTADLPALQETGPAMFSGCTGLRSVSLPVCESVGDDAFIKCTHLQSIELPSCKEVGAGAFYSCTTLSYIDLGECSFIREYGYHSDSYGGTFQDCVQLSAVILRGSSSVCKLGNNDYTMASLVFENTPIVNCSGAVYVHPVMLGDYKTAAQWSNISCALRSYYAESGSYYISWEQPLTSGSFIVDGHTCFFADFNSHYDWLDGVVPSNMFTGRAAIEHIDTNAYEVGDGAFRNCMNLSHIDLSYCEVLGSYALQNTSISVADLPVCSDVRSGAFRECSRLLEVSLPVCESIGGYAFSWCSMLSQIDLPSCKSVGYAAFDSCMSMTGASLPVCEYIDTYAFRSCRYIASIDLPVCSFIGFSAFQYCSSLSTVVLRSSSVVRILQWGTSLFSGCSALTSILVPSSLVSFYKSDYYWSYIRGKIYSIPEP